LIPRAIATGLTTAQEAQAARRPTTSPNPSQSAILIF